MSRCKVRGPYKPKNSERYLADTIKNAQSFRHIYKLQVDHDPDAGLGSPAGIVCVAFSLELYLKALKCSLCGQHLQEHRIVKLFEDLPKTTQAEILKDMSTQWEPPVSESEFRKKLSDLDNSFVEWRYLQEATDRSKDHSFPESFCYHFAGVIIELLKAESSKVN